jgi:hypothetical protein
MGTVRERTLNANNEKKRKKKRLSPKIHDTKTKRWHNMHLIECLYMELCMFYQISTTTKFKMDNDLSFLHQLSQCQPHHQPILNYCKWCNNTVCIFCACTAPEDYHWKQLQFTHLQLEASTAHDIKMKIEELQTHINNCIECIDSEDVYQSTIDKITKLKQNTIQHINLQLNAVAERQNCSELYTKQCIRFNFNGAIIAKFQIDKLVKLSAESSLIHTPTHTFRVHQLPK